jgi:hypothetical protein
MGMLAATLTRRGLHPQWLHDFLNLVLKALRAEALPSGTGSAFPARWHPKSLMPNLRIHKLTLRALGRVWTISGLCGGQEIGVCLESKLLRSGGLCRT